MNPPTIVFYEHDFEDPIKVSLVKSVLNLGNECRALAEENASLKAEVERLRKAGDYLADHLAHEFGTCPSIEIWQAAKDGITLDAQPQE